MLLGHVAEKTLQAFHFQIIKKAGSHQREASFLVSGIKGGIVF